MTRDDWRLGSMEFIYPLPESNHNQNPSQAVIWALSKKAMESISPIDGLMDRETAQIEKIESQVDKSLSAVNILINQINILRRESGDKIQAPTSDEFEVMLDSKIEEWSNNGSFEWCDEQARRLGCEFMLVATPNTLTPSRELMSLAKTFGFTEKSPYGTLIYEGFYSRYTAKELSGSKSDSQIRLSLISTSLDTDFQGTNEEQRATLKTLQATNPNIHVPSVLDSIAHWGVIREHEVDDDIIMDMTRTRHFDLKSKKSSGRSFAPMTSITEYGKHVLGITNEDGGYQGARLAVG